MCLLSAAAFTQDFTGALSITANEMYGTFQPIMVHGQYVQGNPPTGGIAEYTWELTPIDIDGNLGQVVFSETFAGDPTGDFVFPQAITSNLPSETSYAVNLIARDINGILATSGTARFRISDYTLTGDDEICCGTPITAIGAVHATAVSSTQSYQYSLTLCDANGNSIWPLSYYVSGIIPGLPGVITIPGSGQPYPTGVMCDQYYRIDVDYFGPMIEVSYRVSKVVYVTSFLMKAKSVYCCGQNITASVTNCPGSQYTITHHQWVLQPCSNAQGQNPGAPIYTSAPIAGANGNTDIIPAIGLPCQYYILTARFNNGPTNTVATRTKVIYLSPPPAPTITGPTNICGTGTYCATNLTGSNNYLWHACVGSAVQWSGTTNCVTVPPISWNKIFLQVTDGNGCISYTNQPITNNGISPDFYLWYSSPADATHFKPGFQRSGAAGFGLDAFMVEEVSPTPPYNTVPGSSWSNPGWSLTASWYTIVYFYNYNGDYSPPFSGPSGSAPNGLFRNDRTYRVTRTVDNSGCILSKSIVFDKNGVICYNCRTAGEIENNSIAQTGEITFDIFPNPNNGAFEIQLSGSAENAQAELINMLGERVDAFTITGTKYNYSLAQSLAPGIYLLRITNNGSISSKRIIIE